MSTFNIIVALFAAGIGIVVYINNIITVNQLAFTVNQLQVKYDAVMSMNAALRAEVNNKSARERIGTIAAEQLQLHYPKEQPAWFTVDDEKLKKLRSK